MYACNLLLLPMISLFLVLRLINMPSFALVSYFCLVSISIDFSSFGNLFFGITYPCMLCYALDSLYSLIRLL